MPMSSSSNVASIEAVEELTNDSSSHKSKNSTTITANTTTVDPPLPERSVLDGRYFINLVDIVNESWWKTSNTTNSSARNTTTLSDTVTSTAGNDNNLDDMITTTTTTTNTTNTTTDETESMKKKTSSEWVWKSMGGFLGSIEYRDVVDDEMSQKIIIESFPTSNSQLIQLNPIYDKPKFVTPSSFPDTTDYKVVTTTSKKGNSQTDAPIFIKIVGELDGETKETDWIDFNPNSQFLRGKTQTFICAAEKNVGRIVQIQLKIDGKDLWRCDKVEVTSDQYPTDTFTLMDKFELSAQKEKSAVSTKNSEKRNIEAQFGSTKFIDDQKEDFVSRLESYRREIRERKLAETEQEALYQEKLLVQENAQVRVEIATSLKQTTNDLELLESALANSKASPSDAALEELMSQLNKLGRNLGEEGTGTRIIDGDVEMTEGANNDNKLNEMYQTMAEEEVDRLKVTKLNLIDSLLINQRSSIFNISFEIMKRFDMILRDIDNLVESPKLSEYLESEKNEGDNTTFQDLRNELSEIRNDVETAKEKFDDMGTVTKDEGTITNAIFVETFSKEKEGISIQDFTLDKKNGLDFDLKNLYNELISTFQSTSGNPSFFKKALEELDSRINDLENTREKTESQVEEFLQTSKEEANLAIRELGRQEATREFLLTTSQRRSNRIFQSFLLDESQIPTSSLVGDFDNFGFYKKHVKSSNFDISLDDFNFQVNGSGILPNFGLMVRDTLALDAKYFGLLFVPRSVPGKYNICTFVRTRDGQFSEMTGSFDVGEINNNRKFSLKIVRQGHIFQGFLNGRLVGEAKLVLQQKSAKSKRQQPTESERLLSSQTIKEKVIVGVSCYTKPKFKVNNTVLPDTLSSKVILRKNPILNFLTSPDALTKKSFAIVEYYNISIFQGKSGPGRILNTFSLLPGETTEIALKTYKDTSSTTENTSTVFDEVTDASALDLEKSIEEEQSKEAQYEKSMGFHAEASASYSGYGASASVNAGYEENSSSARQEMARSLTKAISKHATKASSKRTVEVNTTATTEVQEGSSSSIRRTLQNINNSTTLDFVFRQMNQQYIHAVSLVDLKIAYIGGGEGTYAEEPISKLKSFLGRYIQEGFIEGEDENQDGKEDQGDGVEPQAKRETYVEKVMNDIYQKAGWILDWNSNPLYVLEDVEKKFGSKEFKFKRFNKTNITTLPTKYNFVKVPGFVIDVGTNVLRTDGILTESKLGAGIALDDYGRNLELEDIAEKRAQTNLLKGQKELLDLQKDIFTAEVQDGNSIKRMNIQQRLEGLQYLNLLESK
jgi:hypothetical protein